MTPIDQAKYEVIVYHSAFGDGFNMVASVLAGNDMNIVALEKAYHMTNNLGKIPWCKDNREDLTVYVDKCRSTSVDDYMRLIDLDTDKETWYRVDDGFEVVEDDTEIEYVGRKDGKRCYENLTFKELREKYGA